MNALTTVVNRAEMDRRRDSFQRMQERRAACGGRITAISLGLRAERQASKPDAQPKQQQPWLFMAHDC